MKTLFLVAYLRRAGSRPLTSAERGLLSPMIRRSDDVAATRVRDALGASRVRRAARLAGMRSLRLDPVWGLSTTTAADQARLFWRLRSLLPARHREFGLWLLRHVVPFQRWGIGEVRLPSGWRVWFKDGWGSGTGQVDHQTALLERGSRRVVVAVTTVDNGSHSAGQATLRGVFVRLLRHLR